MSRFQFSVKKERPYFVFNAISRNYDGITHMY